MSLLGRVYRRETVDNEHYNFDDEKVFTVPDDGDHASYLDHCKVIFCTQNFSLVILEYPNYNQTGSLWFAFKC